MSESHPMLPETRVSGDAVIAKVKGDVDLNNSPQLRQGVLALIKENKPKRLILNLSSVSYMDSSAIAVLVEARKTGTKVCLVGLQPRVKGLLEIARLDSIFVIARDEAEAMTK